jgi:TRAP-type mannitol/chloroaromatic compound transport system substrate-binding protein
MHRRKFLTGAALGATGLGLAAPVCADGPRLQWRLASSVTHSNEVIWQGLESLARRVAAATGGKFQIQLFNAGELVPAFGVLDAVKDGTLQLGHSSGFYYIGKDPTFAFDTTLPFGLNSRQQTAWMFEGGGLGLLRELYRDYNIHNIPCGDLGVLMGGWFRKEIHTAADLKGLKFRISGLAGQVLAKLGATPQVIASSETYPALERGTIDAAKLSGPADDEKSGLNRIAKYYYAPGWADGCLQISLMVNLDAWHGLPPAYQAILESAAMRVHVDMQAGYDVANAAAIRRLVASGTQLRRFPNEVLEAIYAAAMLLYDEIGAKNPRFKSVYDHWRRFRGQQIAWFGVAERPFDNFMARSMGSK